MAGSITVGGNKIFEHTGATGSGVVQMLDQNGNPIITDTGTSVTIDNVGFGNSTSFPLSGRNLIINGDFRVNQRGAASRTETSNAYNYDRWYYDGTYLYQVIEDLNVVNGDYTISWSGSGLTAGWVISSNTTSSIPTGFTSVTSGSSFTVSGKTTGDHLWIRFGGTLASLANLADVQVEAGTVATPFERRLIGTELALCQRYYEICENSHRAHGSGGETYGGSSLVYKVEKRVAPEITFISYGSRSILTFQEKISITKHGAGIQYTNASTIGSYAYGTLFEVDAEL